MKTLNKSASRTFAKLLQGLQLPGDARKIDTANGSFMPVSVDFLANEGGTRFYSVAHYYERNGDLCPDPDVQFAVIGSGAGELVIPFSITQTFGHRDHVRFDGGRPTTYNPGGQADLTSFCNMWLKNIRAQQHL